MFPRFDLRLRHHETVLELVRLVAGLHDVTVMRESIQQGRRHLGVPKDTRPFRETQVGRDDDAGVPVKLGQEMKQQGTARLTKR